jgi:hypothetical protein
MMCDHLAEEALVDEEENDQTFDEGGAKYLEEFAGFAATVPTSRAWPIEVSTHCSCPGDAVAATGLQEDVRPRKVPWSLYGRCVFSLCGSLIHNAGAWNLADLYIM